MDKCMTATLVISVVITLAAAGFGSWGVWGIVTHADFVIINATITGCTTPSQQIQGTLHYSLNLAVTYVGVGNVVYSEQFLTAGDYTSQPTCPTGVIPVWWTSYTNNICPVDYPGTLRKAIGTYIECSSVGSGYIAMTVLGSIVLGIFVVNAAIISICMFRNWIKKS
jgi:hypothetical protein